MPLPSTALVTLDEALGALRIPGTTAEVELVERLVAAVSERLDEIIGPTVARSISKRWDMSAYTRAIAGPLMSLTSVEDAGNPVNTSSVISLNSSDFSEVLLVKSSGEWWLGPTEITWQAGRVSSTVEVPARIKEACLLTVRHLWRSVLGERTQVQDFEVPESFFPRWAFPTAALDLVSDLASSERMPLIG